MTELENLEKLTWLGSSNSCILPHFSGILLGHSIDFELGKEARLFQQMLQISKKLYSGNKSDWGRGANARSSIDEDLGKQTLWIT